MRRPRFWIAAGSLILVLGIGLSDVRRTSPGELSAVHGAKVELTTGWGSCGQCHGGWFQSMGDACLECHEPVANQIADGDGFHGALGRNKAMECATCHSEHHGTNFAIVNQASFANAGFPSARDFDHAFVGFEMKGKHLEQACGKCHVNADVNVLPEGQPRFAGLDQDCAKCHKDPHEGRMVLQCAQCHGQLAFNVPASVDHDRHLPLTGGHARVACRDCHKEGGPHALEALGKGSEPKRRTCLDCHTSPHDEGFLARVAARVEELPSQACATCHRPDHVSFADERVEVTPEMHALTGFPLAPPHDGVSCEQCHPDRGTDFKARHPGRSPDTCNACHRDPHGGQFDGKACLECHRRDRFAPHDYTLEKHNASGFALAGSHAAADCAGCHKVPAKGAPRVFAGTPKTCAACHKDAHYGFFDRRAGKPVACSECHAATKFGDRDDTAFDHARWTGFELRGAHLQDACESCHARAKEPDPRGRAFGRVEQRFGKFEDCATCHTDPHRGTFDRPGRPRTIEGRTSCARCHDDTSFRTLRKFDHGVWTGFPLEGHHAKADCAACHRPLVRPDRLGRRGAPAKGRRCADCHADPHAGQFDRKGVTRCETCHRGATSFRDLSFVHDVHSRFKLGEAHEKVACDRCHKPVRSNGRTFIRYRPLGMRCVDCHGTAKDPLRRRPGRAK